MAKHYVTVTANNLPTMQTSVLNVLPTDMKTTAGFTFLNRLANTAIYDSVKAEVASFLNDEGVANSVSDIALYVMNGNSTFDIHTNIIVTDFNPARYIIPLENCDNVYYDFYSSNTTPTTVDILLSDGLNSYQKYEANNCVFLESAQFNSVLLTNTIAPYAPRNAGANTAICLSIFLDGTPNLSASIPDYV